MYTLDMETNQDKPITTTDYSPYKVLDFKYISPIGKWPVMVEVLVGIEDTHHEDVQRALLNIDEMMESGDLPRMSTRDVARLIEFMRDAALEVETKEAEDVAIGDVIINIWGKVAGVVALIEHSGSNLKAYREQEGYSVKEQAIEKKAWEARGYEPEWSDRIIMGRNSNSFNLHIECHKWEKIRVIKGVNGLNQPVHEMLELKVLNNHLK